MKRPDPSFRVATAFVFLVVALDQWTKSWALRALQNQPPRAVIPRFFDLTLNRNTGGVFGLLAGPPSTGRRIFFITATIAALAVILSLLRHYSRESRMLFAGLALVAGGAVGNLIDRIRFGSVVDFIDWYWRSYHWPTFNIADSAITTGTALILLRTILPQRRSREAGFPGDV